MKFTLILYTSILTNFPIIFGHIPFGNPCRESVFFDRATTGKIQKTANPDCKKGLISWQYPEDGQSLFLTWTPNGIKGRFWLCLDGESSMNNLKKVVDVTGGRKMSIPVSKALLGKGTSYCVASVNGSANLVLQGGDWVYVQFIEYYIEPIPVKMAVNG